jgi:hypothetical protein
MSPRPSGAAGSRRGRRGQGARLARRRVPAGLRTDPSGRLRLVDRCEEAGRRGGTRGAQDRGGLRRPPPPAAQQKVFEAVKCPKGSVDLLPKWDSYTMGLAPDGRQRFVHPEVQKKAYTRRRREPGRARRRPGRRDLEPHRQGRSERRPLRLARAPAPAGVSTSASKKSPPCSASSAIGATEDAASGRSAARRHCNCGSPGPPNRGRSRRARRQPCAGSGARAGGCLGTARRRRPRGVRGRARP